VSFRLVPKSVTLNDLERRNGRYFALFQGIPYSFPRALRKVVEDILKLSATKKCSPNLLVFSDISLTVV